VLLCRWSLSYCLWSCAPAADDGKAINAVAKAVAKAMAKKPVAAILAHANFIASSWLEPMRFFPPFLVRYRYRDLRSIELSGLFWSRWRDFAEPSRTRLLKNQLCADRTLTLPREQTAATPHRTAQSDLSKCRSTTHAPEAAPPPSLAPPRVAPSD